MQRRGLLFLLLIFALFTSGCSEIGDTVNDVNETVTQGKEDVDYLKWMKGSIDIIHSDYADIKQALEARDMVALERAAGNLTANCRESKETMQSFSPSPGLQPVTDRYSQILNQSCSLGIFLEDNAATLNFSNETTLQRVEKNMGLVNNSLILNN
ncbi:hypothetical protein [Methanohalophilus halophilus]|uniref:Uncharacterized protein n=1 Tax=Methanohalophilus halophilus TaxID=2177 RepID=A0A1L3Q181_9EURY|nr:hypothetical protein [Methanohalophilus halophilus]APH38615.1 hypothetical protein BHR79_03340 [Methanohalophilus halophilus]RNI08386.1 hypothetical protein EFE40_07520 [Methanohalophilus halophilus]SDW17037.1 hypothetical protein SAMN04515625_0502 [Methanohalophilus halophilus]